MDISTVTEISPVNIPVPPKAKPPKAKAKSPKAAKPPVEISLAVEKMSKNERKLIMGLFASTPTATPVPFTIKGLQGILTKSTKSTIPARNALRRLVRAGWLERTVVMVAEKPRRAYRLTQQALKRGI
jgi:hypothetical protein